MSKRKRSQKELEMGLKVHEIDAVTRRTQTIAPWVGGAVIMIFVWLSIHDLAGKITIADISVLAKAVTGEEGAGMCPEWYVIVAFTLFGILGLALAYRERKLRKDNTEHLHVYQRMWESQQDSSRTSSRLTRRGDTRQEDK